MPKAGAESPMPFEDILAKGVALNGQAKVLDEHLLDEVFIVAVHEVPDGVGGKFVTGVLFFQRDQPLFLGEFGISDHFFDEFLGRFHLVEKRLHADLDGTDDIFHGKFDEVGRKRAAQHNEQTRCVEKQQQAAAQTDGCHDEDAAPEKTDDCCNVHAFPFVACRMA